MKITTLPIQLLSLLLCCFALSRQAEACCGIIVSEGKTHAQIARTDIALGRSGTSTTALIRMTITSADTSGLGHQKKLAAVIPVPNAATDVSVVKGGERIFEALNALSIPKVFVEKDRSPCSAVAEPVSEQQPLAPYPLPGSLLPGSGRPKIYSDVESALDSLTAAGYFLPPETQQTLKAYAAQELSLIVVEVSAEGFRNGAAQFLQPMRVTWNSEGFTFPVVESKNRNEGDLFVYTLTSGTSSALANTDAVPLPREMTLPRLVEYDPGRFFKFLGSPALDSSNNLAAVIEYTSPIRECTDCDTVPSNSSSLHSGDLALLGVVAEETQSNSQTHLTRFHLRIPVGRSGLQLQFRSSDQQTPLTVHFTVRHEWRGKVDCEAANDYQQQLVNAQETQAQALSKLTGWDIGDIRARMNMSVEKAS